MTPPFYQGHPIVEEAEMVEESVEQLATETPLPEATAPETQAPPETPPPLAEQTPSDGEVSESPEIDWKSRAEKAEGQFASLNKTLDDERAGAATLNGMAETISDLKFQIAANGLSTNKALKAVQTGNEEDVASAWEEGQQEALNNQADITIKAEYDGLRAEAETLKADTEFASAFVEKVGEINSGKHEDLNGLRTLVAEARDRKNQIVVDGLKAQIAEGEEKFNGARAAFEKEYEVHRTNDGPALGGSGDAITMDNIDDLMVDIKSQPAEKQSEIRAAYRKLRATGSV